jgi:eukaryotic-like serine/threonine-protein kinase
VTTSAPEPMGTDPYGAAAAAAATPVRWPDASAYAIAAREVETFFGPVELRSAVLRRSPLGLPLPATGRNAAVFKATVDDADLAVRVFTRPPNEGAERYRRIGEHILPLEGVLFPNVRWIDDGVHVSGTTWPMIRMDWVEGMTLDHWVGAHLDDPALLRDFVSRWDRLFTFLEHSRIAHGDLQHGNVLVDAQHRIRLVDLDGLWIPELADLPADEFGHVHFQHPGRLTERVWGERMDGFAALLIAVSIVALSHRPELWDAYNDGGNNLIFRNDDFADLEAPIWDDLARLDDPVLAARIAKLRQALGAECAKLHGPVVMLDDRQTSAVVPGTPTWLMSAIDPDHAPASDTSVPPPDAIDPTATVTVHPDALRHPGSAGPRPPDLSPSSPVAAGSDGVPVAVVVAAIVAVLVIAVLVGLAMT